jgi:magnesium transporter
MAYHGPMVRTRLYRNGTLERDSVHLNDLVGLADQEGVTVWVDFTSPTAEELAGIEKSLNLHRLAMENAADEHLRPKLDRYAGHLFLSAYRTELDRDSNRLKLSEVKAFITKGALVTLHGPDLDPQQLTAHWDAEPDLTGHGTTFLLWGLLDYIVDGHFDAVQELDARIDALEDVLFDDPAPDHDLQRRSFELRKSLVRLRRAVLPMREVLNTLLRRDLEVLDPAMQPFLQDVYDHVLRASEWTESLRDLITTILETHISIQGNRMNLVMKKVTSWAAIIAVPTAVTGFFGQNVPFVGFQSPLGLVLSLSLIVIASAGLYLSFKKKEWI